MLYTVKDRDGNTLGKAESAFPSLAVMDVVQGRCRTIINIDGSKITACGHRLVLSHTGKICPLGDSRIQIGGARQKSGPDPKPSRPNNLYKPPRVPEKKKQIPSLPGQMSIPGMKVKRNER